MPGRQAADNGVILLGQVRSAAVKWNDPRHQEPALCMRQQCWYLRHCTRQQNAARPYQQSNSAMGRSEALCDPPASWPANHHARQYPESTISCQCHKNCPWQGKRGQNQKTSPNGVVEDVVGAIPHKALQSSKAKKRAIGPLIMMAAPIKTQNQSQLRSGGTPSSCTARYRISAIC